MDLANTSGQSGSGRARRLALVLAGAVVFLGVASVIKPSPRSVQAQPTDPEMKDIEKAIRSAFVCPVDINSTSPKEGKRLRERAKLDELAAKAPQHPKGWKLIGTLEGREHMVRCWASPEGPRYSVYTLDGRLIQDELPADEVYRGFPDVDLENLRADPPEGSGALMMVDTTRD